MKELQYRQKKLLEYLIELNDLLDIFQKDYLVQIKLLEMI